MKNISTAVPSGLQKVGKVPPQNLELEQFILGAILLDNEALPKAIEGLSGSVDFYKPAHRKIFESILSLYERNEPADLMTLSEALRKKGELEDVGGGDYLADLVDMIPTAANIRAHCKIVREKAILRKLISVASEVGALAFEDMEEVESLLDRVERMILEISQDRSRKSFAAVKSILTGSMEMVEQLYNKKQLVTGAPTGYKELDEKTAGLQPSDLVIVAGRPSMGKTAFALNIAQNLTSIENERVVAVFSLEMSSEQLVLRMLCSEAKVSGHKIRTGYLAQSDWPKLTAAAGRLHDSNIFIDDSPGQTALDIRAKARRLRVEQGRLDLIIVDYLQLMSSRQRVESRVQEVSEITRSLKQLAKELKVPVLAISQLSRKAEDRQDKRPQLSDLRESGSIEQDADLVIFVYRDEFYNPQKPEAQGRADIIIGKQRNGPLATMRLAFLKDFTRFEDLSHVETAAFMEYDDNI
ncbi:Replicative DNA helicase (DnaB) [hydrothermal vent metagenome]|uniref:DNA 5'-3' helicase n=1 Tax=hydrothermal vent metagenome TaxID=652676 RepID=A0A3B1C0J6_9ZZZZ